MRLVIDADRPAAPDERSKYRELVKRRMSGECVAYILGYRDFYEHRFAVTSDVLVPRPETERIVDLVLPEITKMVENGPLRCADLGTGSGCLGLSLHLAHPENTYWDLWDISQAALHVAERNAKALGAKVGTMHGDVLSVKPTQPYDILVSNPPYVSAKELEAASPEVRAEPHVALLGGGEDGADWYRRFCEVLPLWSRDGTRIWLEIGAGQAGIVVPLLRAQNAREIVVHKDFSGLDRVVSAVVSKA